MQQYYIPKHFAAHEVVDPGTYAKFGNKAFQLIDPRILCTADRLRERYGKPIYINTYRLKSYKGKTLRFCGYRPKTYMNGADYSEHRHGRALDLHIVGVTAEQVRQDILADPFHEDFKYITAIEASVSWLHIDCRNIDKQTNGILIVHP